MAITISKAWQVVIMENQTLTPSARLEVQSKLQFYRRKHEGLVRALSDTERAETKLKQILEYDNKLRS
jgi:hypothetical protein